MFERRELLSIATAKLFEQDLIFAEIDSLEVQRARRFSRHFLDEDPSLVEQSLKRIRLTNGMRSSEKPS